MSVYFFYADLLGLRLAIDPYRCLAASPEVPSICPINFQDMFSDRALTTSSAIEFSKADFCSPADQSSLKVALSMASWEPVG